MKTIMPKTFIACCLMSVTVHVSGQEVMPAEKPARNYFHQWMLISVYQDGSDTLYYEEGRNGKLRMSSWDNSIAFTDGQSSLVVDKQEQTMLLLPVRVGSRKGTGPIDLPDSLWAYFEEEAPVGHLASDSSITMEQDDASVQILYHGFQQYPVEINIQFKRPVSSDPDEQEPVSAHWKLVRRETAPNQVNALVNRQQYLTRSGKNWHPASAYSHFEFINLLNENTD